MDNLFTVERHSISHEETGFGNFHFLRIGEIKILTVTINRTYISITIPDSSVGAYTSDIDIPDRFRPLEGIKDLVHTSLTNKLLDFTIQNGHMLYFRGMSGSSITNVDYNGNTISYQFVYY